MTDDVEAGGSPPKNPVARWTRGVLTALVSIVMFAMMMLTTADVAGRALLNKPIPGSFEIATFLLAILIFASLPLITWDQKHITVNLFERWIGGAFQRVLNAVLLLVSTGVVAMMTERMWVQGRLMDAGGHITGFLEWPIAPIAYTMAVLSGLTTLILAALTWRAIAEIGRARNGSG